MVHIWNVFIIQHLETQTFPLLCVPFTTTGAHCLITLICTPSGNFLLAKFKQTKEICTPLRYVYVLNPSGSRNTILKFVLWATLCKIQVMKFFIPMDIIWTNSNVHDNTWHFTTSFLSLELNINNLTTGLCKFVLNFFEVATFKGRYHPMLGAEHWNDLYLFQ